MLHKLRFNTEFTRFLFVGGIAAGVNFFSRIFISQFTSFRIAVVIAYLIGMTTAYILARFFVFMPSGKHPAHEFLHFGIVNLLAILQVWIISVGLAEYIFPLVEFNFFAEEVAHFIGICVPAVTSYYGHKYFSFKQVKT